MTGIVLSNPSNQDRISNLRSSRKVQFPAVKTVRKIIKVALGKLGQGLRIPALDRLTPKIGGRVLDDAINQVFIVWTPVGSSVRDKRGFRNEFVNDLARIGRQNLYLVV